MRPARETLFTIVSREDKYKSKAFIDTAVYRAGDSVTAWLEGGISRLGGLIALAAFAVPLAVVWLGLAIWLGREQERDVERRAVPELVRT
jgi:AAA family ATP:ADP antiporter